VAEERTFLSDGSIYVSNTKVVIHGTTYSTANITSVRKSVTPAKTGCASILVVIGALTVVGGVIGTIASHDNAEGIVMGAVMLVIGIVWFRSLKPAYHVMLASASGERQGLTSNDESLVSRVTSAIGDAITYRG
jgi:hypothetical protein